jgi:hypothetical protein
MVFGLVIIGIILWIFVAFWPARVAKSRGYNFWLFLILSWFISFLLALALAYLLPNKHHGSQSGSTE